MKLQKLFTSEHILQYYLRFTIFITKSLLFKYILYTEDLGVSQTFNDNFATKSSMIHEAVSIQGSADGFTQYMDSFSKLK